MKTFSLLAAAVLAVSLPAASFAAEDGELWEVSSKMGMPDMPEMPEGMPPGMEGMMPGARKSKVCRGTDPREAVSKDKEMRDCEITDLKTSGAKTTMSIKCKGGRSGKMEHVYNKARTEYTGTMTMKDPEHGEMKMTTTGKKIGTCDVAKTNDERKATADKYKAQAEEASAQGRRFVEQAESQQIAGCEKAVETMNPGAMGVWACSMKKDEHCKTLEESTAKQSPKVAKVCAAKSKELCRKYETTEGYLKLSQGNHLRDAERMCDVDAEDLRPGLCKKAVKADFYEFIGAHCPKDAKPLAKEHCAGRSYTVPQGDKRAVETKWRKFCAAVAGAANEDSSSRSESSDDEAPVDSKKEAKKAAKKAAVNAIKGLFGR